MCSCDKKKKKKRTSTGAEVGSYKASFRDPRSIKGRVGGKARQGGWGQEYLLRRLLCSGEMESLAVFKQRSN